MLDRQPTRRMVVTSVPFTLGDAEALGARTSASHVPAIVGRLQERFSVTPDTRTVWVVHGRNTDARDALFTFLRSLNLRPLEWAQAVRATGSGAPYIGDVLDKAFEAAQAVVVLFTPDEIAYLRSEYASGPGDDQTQPAAQARPNVLFEAGMAFGRHPERTILVEMGQVRAFSDVEGRHAVRLDNDLPGRKELAQRLQTAGCDVDLSGDDWLTAGDLSAPQAPAVNMGRRIPGNRPRGAQLDARYIPRDRGGRLQITNTGSVPLFKVDVDLDEEQTRELSINSDLPIPRLPPGKTATLLAFASRSLGGNNPDYMEIVLRAETEEGSEVAEDVFLDLLGT